jgi:hypothetical protein
MGYGLVRSVATRSACLLCLLLPLAAGAIECSYVPNKAAGGAATELAAQGDCGELVGQDGLRISREHLARLRFRDGLAELYAGDKAFYVDRSGKAVRVLVFDNAADEFSEGLARTLAGGRLGYIDRRLRIVVKPEYDFGFPFAKGRAVVCIGCAAVAEGEHQAMRGGRWGMIDRSGAQVVPLRHTREELERIARGAGTR